LVSGNPRPVTTYVVCNINEIIRAYTQPGTIHHRHLEMHL
jgi:hypothetical protein